MSKKKSYQDAATRLLDETWLEAKTLRGTTYSGYLSKVHTPQTDWTAVSVCVLDKSITCAAETKGGEQWV